MTLKSNRSEMMAGAARQVNYDTQGQTLYMAGDNCNKKRTWTKL